MSNRNTVIDLNSRRKQKSQNEKPQASLSNEVVDISALRKAAILEERRAVKRTILTEFIGAFIVLPNIGLKKVSLYDISDKGLSFDLEMEEGRLNIGEEVAMRVYLSQYTYFPFVVKVSNTREIPEEGVTRHGANFVKDTVNTEALHHFVKFIENVSVDLHKDSGDMMRVR